MTNKYLIREYYELCAGGVCQDLLSEAEKKDIKENNAVYLSGVMQRCDEKNGNGRIYPGKILKREVEKLRLEVRGDLRRATRGAWPKPGPGDVPYWAEPDADLVENSPEADVKD